MCHTDLPGSLDSSIRIGEDGIRFTEIKQPATQESLHLATGSLLNGITGLFGEELPGGLQDFLNTLFASRERRPGISDTLTVPALVSVPPVHCPVSAGQLCDRIFDTGTVIG